MRNGKYAKKGHGSKALALVLALVLMVGGVVGGTLAWLLDTTEAVENTFTPSDISIELKESENLDLKMIPGWTITKDPKATVTTDSEDCFLFVKVEETGVSFTPDGDVMPSMYAFSDFMTYEIADGWIELEGEPGVYYRVFDSKDSTNTNAKGTAYSILKNDQVLVKGTVTKEMMDDITEDTRPTLTFTAYAVQLYKSNTEQFTAEEAWEKAAL